MKNIALTSKAALFSLLFVTGCTNLPNALDHGGNPFTQPFNYEKAQALQDDNVTYKGALIAEYKALSTKEGKIWSDWFDSDFFARKALKVAASDTVGITPEDPADWRFTKEEAKQFEPARTQLLAALGEGHVNFPVLAAKAQARFDCWVEEQEEAWQNDEIAKCKGEFEAALAELQNASKDKPLDMAQLYTVFFDFDSAVLTPIGEQVLQALVSDWGAQKVNFALVGHTDRAGKATYNQKLSERRAQAVKDFVVKMGLDGNMVKTSGAGESTPAVATDDGVREAKNRRVVVTVEK